ncbi:MAG: hypothetical protein CVV63_01675, partial [Tenericutes bacterium HGW-Tenericutes-8]
GDIVKKLWIMILLMPIITVKLYANTTIFIWHNTIVEVPLHANIEAFLGIPYASLSEGLKDENLFYEKNGVNYTFISVINTSILKDYRLDYKVSSPRYNKTAIQTITFRIVDLEPPVLTKGILIEVPVKSKTIDYMKYIDYSDNYDAKEHISVTIDTNSINLNQIGFYKVHIILMDRSFNQSRYELTLHIKDYQSPQIVETSNPVVNIGDSVDLMQFYLISDNYDASPNIFILDSEVRYHELGRYPIRIEAFDQSGNHAVYDSFIEIKDIEKPVLSLKTNQLVLPLGENINLYDLIIKAKDNYDTIDINDVLIETDLDINKVGYYEAIYELKDNSNNVSAYKVNIIVRDTKAPVFDIEPIETYDYDSIDLTDQISVSDDSGKPVNWVLVETNLVAQPGKYQALYLAIDAYGNHTYHLRHITLLASDSSDTPTGAMIAYTIFGMLSISVLAYGMYYYRIKKHRL